MGVKPGVTDGRHPPKKLYTTVNLYAFPYWVHS